MSQLQWCGFRRDFIEKLASKADAVEEQVLSATIKADLNAARHASIPLNDLYKKTPDPHKKEKQFTAFITKQGPSMNGFMKGMENIYERAKQQAKDCGINLDAIDTDKTIEVCLGLKANVVNVIHLNTFISLFRLPGLAGSQDKLDMLKQLYEKFEANEDLILLPELKEEYLKFIEPLDAEASTPAKAEPPRKKWKANGAS